MLVQAILFDKNKWNPTEARHWLKKHKYVPIKYVDKTQNQIRYRIRDPAEFSSFVTKSYPDRGINIIFGIN